MEPWLSCCLATQGFSAPFGLNLGEVTRETRKGFCKGEENPYYSQCPLKSLSHLLLKSNTLGLQPAPPPCTLSSQFSNSYSEHYGFLDLVVSDLLRWEVGAVRSQVVSSHPLRHTQPFTGPWSLPQPACVSSRNSAILDESRSSGASI